MEIIRDLDRLQRHSYPVVAFGNFDGVHLGHRAILRTAMERARAAGVTTILTVGTDVDDCRRALTLAEKHDGVFAILGIHPHEAGTAGDGDLAEFFRRAQETSRKGAEQGKEMLRSRL